MNQKFFRLYYIKNKGGWYNMKRKGLSCMLVVLFCFLLGTITVNAADERLGTIVDGSLLTEETEVVGFTTTAIARGTYLSSGEGRLSNKGSHIVNVFGSTTCNRTSDVVKVTLHLQRLVGNTWTTVYTLGPKTATNAVYVSNSKNYTITGGYYYRVKGSHSAKKGSTTESTASYTDGLWIK